MFKRAVVGLELPEASERVNGFETSTIGMWCSAVFLYFESLPRPWGTSPPDPLGFFEVRGRDGHHWPPPAQIRTRTFSSYGSCLESGVESNTGERMNDLR